MSTLSNSRPVWAVAAWLCATFAVGCPATQVRPPDRGNCPRSVVQSMEEMNLFKGPVYRVIIDINQPGKEWETGTYRPGPITSKVVNDSGPLPEGTLLYGQLWTEGVTQENEVVLGRYTEALLPDGRRVPICFILGISGLVTKQEGSKPGEARLRRQLNAIPVERWP